MLISEAFDLHIKTNLIMSNKSPKTIEAYYHVKNIFSNYTNNIKIEELTLDFIYNFKADLSKNLKSDTVRGYILIIRQVLKTLKLLGYETVDYDLVKVPKREKRLIKVLTHQEVETFIKIVSRKSKGYKNINRTRNIAIVRVLASSGIRVSELCSLNIDSIKNRSFTVIGKSKEPRICFIDFETELSLKKYLSLRKDKNKALFLTNYNNRIRPDNVRRIFQFACNNSNFENITPHTLRHSLATYFLDKEVDITYIADLLGHQSLDTTKIYLHYNNKKLQHIYDKVMI